MSGASPKESQSRAGTRYLSINAERPMLLSHFAMSVPSLFQARME